jgi:pyrroline-5-carboxylate reductase
MPNTPAQIGQGMSVWTASSDVPDAIRDFVGQALGSFGEEVFVSEEKYVDMATAVSASGPAYIFRMIDAMTEAGVLLGMPADLARKLVIQTVLGSATLTRESGKHPGELAAMVTSPGGTTAAALMALEEGKFKATVMSAVKAAYDRGEELGGGK